MKKIVSAVLLTTLAMVFITCGDDTPPAAGDTVAPVFSATTTASVNENQLSAITLSASDATTVTYSISETDASFFDVNTTTGVVTFKVAPNYEDNHNGDHTYSFTAMAKDTSDNNSTQSITITILDVAPETITHNGFDYEEVDSPYTAKVWLDRNLGAKQVCTDLNDTDCYGDYYQWGRDTDGHQESNSTTTTALATDLNTSTNASFITNDSSPFDWLDVENNDVDDNGSLRTANWSKTDGTSVCPVGFRVPTIDELKLETIENTGGGDFANNTDAYKNFLKLPSAGYRHRDDGSLGGQGSTGIVWSSSVTGSYSLSLDFESGGANTYEDGRAYGLSVRCLKD